MAYNQYTPATTAYVEAAFKEYDTYVDTDVKGIRERLSSDEESIKTNTANIATNASNIATNTSDIATNASNIATNASNIANLQTEMKTVSYVNIIDEDGVLSTVPSDDQLQVLMFNTSLEEKPTMVSFTPKKSIVAIGGGDDDTDLLGIIGGILIIAGGDGTESCEQSQKEQEADAKVQIDELLGIETEEDDE